MEIHERHIIQILNSAHEKGNVLESDEQLIIQKLGTLNLLPFQNQWALKNVTNFIVCDKLGHSFVTLRS